MNVLDFPESEERTLASCRIGRGLAPMTLAITRTFILEFVEMSKAPANWARALRSRIASCQRRIYWRVGDHHGSRNLYPRNCCCDRAAICKDRERRARDRMDGFRSRRRGNQCAETQEERGHSRP